MGASRNSFFGMKCKAWRAQQPECTLWYMRIASTPQRSNSPEQRIYRSALKNNLGLGLLIGLDFSIGQCDAPVASGR